MDVPPTLSESELDWRGEPATRLQRAKLRDFGIRPKPKITKEWAFDQIRAAAKEKPELEKTYQEAAKENAKEQEEEARDEAREAAKLEAKEAKEEYNASLEELEDTVNDPDWREIFETKALTKTQIRQLESQLTKTGSGFSRDEVFRTAIQLFPDLKKTPPAKKAAGRNSKSGGCLGSVVTVFLLAVIVLFFKGIFFR